MYYFARGEPQHKSGRIAYIAGALGRTDEYYSPPSDDPRPDPSNSFIARALLLVLAGAMGISIAMGLRSDIDDRGYKSVKNSLPIEVFDSRKGLEELLREKIERAATPRQVKEYKENLESYMTKKFFLNTLLFPSSVSFLFGNISMTYHLLNKLKKKEIMKNQD